MRQHRRMRNPAPASSAEERPARTIALTLVVGIAFVVIASFWQAWHHNLEISGTQLLSAQRRLWIAASDAVTPVTAALVLAAAIASERAVEYVTALLVRALAILLIALGGVGILTGWIKG